MTDRPIIFSAPMVRALIEGRKTQTRRVMRPSNSDFGSATREYWDHADFARAWPDRGVSDHAENLQVPCHEGECPVCEARGWTGTTHRLWPRVEIGNRLWVREAHAFLSPGEEPVRLRKGRVDIEYRADTVDPYPGDWPEEYARGNPEAPKWLPSIHMPRWASRITLTVTEIKIERLQDISEADAQAEGIEQRYGTLGTWNTNGSLRCGGSDDPREAFRCLWINIHGTGTWEPNPWVAALSFTVTLRNIYDAEPGGAG